MGMSLVDDLRGQGAALGPRSSIARVGQPVSCLHDGTAVLSVSTPRSAIGHPAHPLAVRGYLGPAAQDVMLGEALLRHEGAEHLTICLAVG